MKGGSVSYKAKWHQSFKRPSCKKVSIQGRLEILIKHTSNFSVNEWQEIVYWTVIILLSILSILKNMKGIILTTINMHVLFIYSTKANEIQIRPSHSQLVTFNFSLSLSSFLFLAYSRFKSRIRGSSVTFFKGSNFSSWINL